MSVLVFADYTEGKFKKTALELVSYGHQLAEKLNSGLFVLTINANDHSALSAVGAKNILKINDPRLDSFNAQAYAECIRQASDDKGAEIILTDSTNNGLYLAPVLAVKLNAAYASNAVALPEDLDPFTVKRKAFSSKGYNYTEIKTEKKLIGLAKNSFGLINVPVEPNETVFDPKLNDHHFGVKHLSEEKTSGKISIADADIVVSGGRGLKGPENWAMIEDLAEVLGAATACSKPVSDMGWRPHSEHVGQTGKPVTSNLYIAIGISGAIQHLAGVNSSKVKVVINSDPDAPFFKAADYGIVGDAFEVVPELIEKLKVFKSSL